MANAKNTAQTAKPEVTEGLKAKIAALIAKANGTDNEHEAAAFMNKAMEMMQKYQLESWELRDKEDPMGMTPIWSTNKNPVTWKKYLVNLVAMYYGARSLMVPTGTGWTFYFVGRESARVTATEMYPFIYGQVVAWGKKLAESHPELNAKQHTRKVCHNLTYRLAQIVAERNEQYAAERDAKGNKGAIASHALTTLDETEAYMNRDGAVQKSKGGKIGTGGRIHREAADSVKLEKQVQGGANAGTAQITNAGA